MSYASQCIAMTSSDNNTTIQTYLAVLADEVVGLIVKERYWQPKLKGRNNFNKIIGCHDKWLMYLSHSRVNLSCTNAKEKTNKKGH